MRETGHISGPCALCGYLFSKEKKKRRLCVFLGERVFPDDVRHNCQGFHLRQYGSHEGEAWATT